ncbi:PEP/pyruvate-binding domain-containing protein [Desulfosporosinus sp. PR]|uniref:PEP/pyruvate-binding domain-containing protein n=1 Tax=Candidatus Desulfosporosinus nitrosoreducens TaxID=3401928 RepID=UPI0027F08A8D|nr:PEP/pyruvate-binding domain-containing protein [Desulfosporosinus sp. PR]MDQ7093594.1 PEP/pyruvate-binding domain-containing protein [Desulfosporosinus sp. PR]
MADYIKRLAQLNGDSLPEAGGKGANLGVLMQAGLPVPPGFVVTTGAYAAHLQESGLPRRIGQRLQDLREDELTSLEAASREITAWIAGSPMPAAVREEISGAWEGLGEETGLAGELAVAVRSSATAEDLPSASFAGQHETFLGVYGSEAVFQQIKNCWASLWSPQAISYRLSMGFAHLEVDLAVVVQAMIASEAAGVMFTANPVNGNREEVLISAGYGLGESVVSGLITPDTFILSKDGKLKERTLGSKESKIVLTKTGPVTEEVPLSQRAGYCLDLKELTRLAELAQAVERHFGAPQDTEWALCRGKIYLLQARPVTTLSGAEADLKILGPEDQIIYQGKKAPLGLQSVMEHSPYPHKPLDFASFKHFYQALNKSFCDAGLKPPKQEIEPVERASGCVAVCYQTPSLSPAVLWKMPPALIKECCKDTEKSWQALAREMQDWLKRMDEATAQSNDRQKLTKLLQQALRDYEKFTFQRFAAVTPAGGWDDLKLKYYIKKAVGKESAEDFKERLMRALPFRTALQNKGLLKLAQTARLQGEDSPAFARELETFLRDYGDRPSAGMGRMIAPPTWREKPELIQELIAALGSAAALPSPEESDTRQAADLEAAQALIKKGLGPKAYRKFLQILDKVRDSVIIREESVFCLEKVAGCLHRLALKIGSLLAGERVIAQKEDVFFLFLEELEEGAQGSQKLRERIEKRKRAYAQVYAAHETGVHWMIATGSFPEFVTKQQQKKKRAGEEGAGVELIQGSPASRGVYEGPVCIVRNTAEFTKLKPGDVLVSPYTTPTWTPLFKVASAAVTEIGSAGSHAAIVAREYGIPAVVAIANVTKRLQDGQRIRVDGTKGSITLL